ncbi:MAG TPA: galactose-1-phosphate uridylyltransferase [Anaeromyxobacteraceae bacterium]|jgi:UDPglucose--hexose-1-phosphate uridylyltransferase
MPEARKNAVTGEWVIVAPERARRPGPEAPPAPRERPPWRADCPFCPGSEPATPGVTFSFPDGEWRVRSFPNLFSVLARDGEPWRREEGLRQAAAAVGPHEVVCETRRHDLSLSRLPDGEVADVVRAWHARTLAFNADPRVAFVSLFKNHGPGAGASQEHAHSQIVGLPLVPAVFARRAALAERHCEATGACLLCRTLEEELEDGRRVVQATARFVTFVPWAALSPYHLWIFPRRHAAAFSAAGADELAELGAHLGAVLRRVERALGDPDYNLVVQSSPLDRAGSPALHWYVSVVPRTTRQAGFELGTAMYVNPSLPEDSAARLRGAG